MAQLNVGDVIKTNYGAPIKVKKLISDSGGQGYVYLVEFKGENKALKWYKTTGKNPSAFYDNLKRNIDKGSPSKVFCWPLQLTEKIDDTFGYVMDLIPTDSFKEIKDYLLATVKFPSFKAAVEACMQIVSAFRILHNNGYSYQDLNDGNFYINPNTGDVIIADNDNVAPDKTNMGIIGKPRYMAPEIVVGKSLPDIQSDRFSLAVILFILLFNNHPLEGKKWRDIICMTPSNAEKLYGTEPAFIFDEKDKSNIAVPKINDNAIKRWKFMPKYIKDAFLNSFSKEALQNPDRRLREIDWLKVLTRFRSEIIKCPCGNEIFVTDTSNVICEACNKKQQIPNIFVLPEYSIAAVKGAWVYRCQVEMCKADEALTPILHVVSVKQGNTVMIGWQNMLKDTLRAINSKGEEKLVPPGTIVPLKAGIKIYPFNKEIKII